MKKVNAKKIDSFSFFVQKLSASVSIISLILIMLCGFKEGVSAFTISLRSLIVLIVIGLISRLIIKVLASYEEINSG